MTSMSSIPRSVIPSIYMCLPFSPVHWAMGTSAACAPGSVASAADEHGSSFLSLLRARRSLLDHDSLEQVRQFVEARQQQSGLHGSWYLIPKEHCPIGCAIDQELLIIRLEVDGAVLQQTHLEEGPRIQQDRRLTLFTAEGGPIHRLEPPTTHLTCSQGKRPPTPVCLASAHIH